MWRDKKGSSGKGGQERKGSGQGRGETFWERKPAGRVFGAVIRRTKRGSHYRRREKRDEEKRKGGGTEREEEKRTRGRPVRRH